MDRVRQSEIFQEVTVIISARRAYILYVGVIFLQTHRDEKGG